MYHFSTLQVCYTDILKMFNAEKIIFDKFTQGLHWLEKYLNLEGFLEKSLKINLP